MTFKRGDCIQRLAFSGVIVLSLLSGAILEAQVESGKIVGAGRDTSGAALADATVTVTETNTNVARKLKTGTNGDYVVTELQPGSYRVTVEHEGFKKAEEPAFKLDVNQVVRADFQLSVGSVLETIQVTAAAAD